MATRFAKLGFTNFEVDDAKKVVSEILDQFFDGLTSFQISRYQMSDRAVNAALEDLRSNGFVVAVTDISNALIVTITRKPIVVGNPITSSNRDNVHVPTKKLPAKPSTSKATRKKKTVAPKTVKSPSTKKKASPVKKRKK